MNKKDWEKEFDKPSFWADLKPIQKKGIKQFINSLLAKQKKELVEKLEKAKEEPRIYLKDGNFLLEQKESAIYKYTIDQAIKTIKGRK